MKRFLTFAAFAAVALSSCSKEGVIDEANGNNGGGGVDPTRMAFGATTSRAATNTLYDVAPGGFEVYATKVDTEGDDPTAFYTDGETGTAKIDGTFNYINVDGSTAGTYSPYAWEWVLASDATKKPVEAPLWPEGTFYMKFYAIYPDQDLNGVANATNVAGTLRKEHTVGEDRFAQDDHLSAVETATTAPGNGRLNLQFLHILSQVNVSATAAVGHNLKVQSVKFHNIDSKGTYDYSTDYKTTTASSGWTGQGTDIIYPFLDTYFPGSANHTTGEISLNSTEYNVNLNVRGGVIDAVNNPTYSMEQAGTPTDVAGADEVEGTLMLVPQNFTSVNLNVDGSLKSGSATGDAGVKDADAGTYTMNAGIPYIEVLYRLDNGGTGDAFANIVGRADILTIDDSQNMLYYKDPTTDAGSVITSKEQLDEVDGTDDGQYVYAGYRAAGADLGDYFLSDGDSGLGDGIALEDATKEDKGYAITGDQLFIKAYFPLSTIDPNDNTKKYGIASLTRGISYNFVLNFDETKGNGGYFADNEYYDESGNPLGLYHGGEPGDPILTERRIHFNVLPFDWATGDPVDLLPELDEAP